MTKKFDIIVLGDGISGWTMASILARAGQSVAVVGRSADPIHIGEYLPPEGCMAVEALGFSKLLDHTLHRASPGVISLWGTPEKQVTPVMTRPGGRAFCLDRLHLHNELRQRALRAGAERFTWKGRMFAHNRGWAIGTVTQEVTGRILVDASGRVARGAQASGAKTHRDDELIAFASLFSSAPCADGHLVIESLDSGWCYTAPLTQDRQVVVFLSDSDLAPRSVAARAEFAKTYIAKTELIAARLGSAVKDSFQTVPAWSQITQPSAGRNWVAIGDAAMAFDPLSSAGLTKAMRDVVEACDIILQDKVTDLHELNSKREERYQVYRRSLAESYLAERRYSTTFWERRANLFKA